MSKGLEIFLPHSGRIDHNSVKILMCESELNPKTMGASMHLHRKMEEIFYILEGELSIIIGTEHVIGHAGDIILIPRGTSHRFSKKSRKHLRLLLIFSLGQASEGCLNGMAELIKRGEAYNSKSFLSLVEKYDQELVETEDNWLEDFN